MAPRVLCAAGAMRRFVRTHFVRRVCQYTVVQDSQAGAFELWRFSAEAGLAVVAKYAYDRDTEHDVRGVAVRFAGLLAEAEREGRSLPEEVLAAAAVDTTAARLGRALRRRRPSVQEQP